MSDLKWLIFLEQDLAAIQDIHVTWIGAELNGDYSKIIELCTEDISWIPPNTPPLNGKEAIAQYLSEPMVDLKDIQIEDVVIRGNDSIAYLTSRYDTWFMLADDSEIQQAAGTHLWILRKDGDGPWRVAIVTWSVWARLAPDDAGL